MHERRKASAENGQYWHLVAVRPTAGDFGMEIFQTDREADSDCEERCDILQAWRDETASGLRECSGTPKCHERNGHIASVA